MSDTHYHPWPLAEVMSQQLSLLSNGTLTVKMLAHGYPAV